MLGVIGYMFYAQFCNISMQRLLAGKKCMWYYIPGETGFTMEYQMMMPYCKVSHFFIVPKYIYI